MPIASEAATELAPKEASLSKLRPGPGLSPEEVAEHQRDRIRRATIEIVATQGYDALTVREITRRARISSKTQYALFASKELAFRHTHEHVVRRLLRSLAEAQLAPGSWRDGVKRIFDALFEEVAHDPLAARLALIEAGDAGREAVERMQLVDRALGAAIAECLGRTPEGRGVSPRLIASTAAGAMGVVRSRLLDGEGEDLPALGDALSRWALSYADPSSADLDDLNRAMAPTGRREASFPPASWNAEKEPASELSALLAATARLAATGGYESLSVREVLAASGIPRRRFYKNFSRMEDCFAAAFAWQVETGVSHIRVESPGRRTPAATVCGAISALTDRVATDEVFASLCFGELTAPANRIVECRQRFVAELGHAILGDAASTADPLALEASMWALWGALHNEVVAGRAHRAGGLNATLSYLALAATIDTPAVNAIREQVSVPTGKRGPTSRLAGDREPVNREMTIR